MLDWIGKAIDWIKSPSQTAIVFVASIGFLLLPHSWAHRSGIDELQRYRGWVAVAAFVSGAALLVALTTRLWDFLSDARDKRHAIKERVKYLRTLSPGEKFIVAKYINADTETQYLPVEDGNVGALLGKGIIYRASDVGRFTTFAFNVQPWVKEYLAEHGDVLNDAKPPLKTPFQRTRA